MARVLSPPHFPVRIEELRGDWSIDGIEPGSHTFEGFEVTALEIPHKLSRTFGFRVSDGTATMAIVWFIAAWMRKKIHPGMRSRAYPT